MSAFASAFAAVLIALVAAYVFVPDIRARLGDRNGLVAWITTAALGSAVVVGV